MAFTFVTLKQSHTNVEALRMEFDRLRNLTESTTRLLPMVFDRHFLLCPMSDFAFE